MKGLLGIKEVSKIFPLLGALLLVLLLIFFTEFVLCFVLILPVALLFRPRKTDLLIFFPIIIAFSLILIAVNAVLLDSVNLKVSLGSLALLAFLEAVCILWAIKKYGIKRIKTIKVNKVYLVAIYFVSLVTLWSRVVSIFGFPAPILHDPISHAYWLKKIVEEGSIDYFYSPGLHIVGAIFHEVTGATYARSIGIVTNLFSAFSVLLWGIVMSIASKSTRIGYWVSFALAISAMPLVLYFTAGKNSLISAFALMPILFFSAIAPLKHRLFKYGLVSITLFGIGLFHYPVFAFSATSYLLFTVATGYLELGTGNLMKVAGRAIIPVLLSGLLLGTFMVSTRLEDPQVKYVSRSQASIIQQSYSKEPLSLPSLDTAGGAGASEKYSLTNPVSATKSVMFGFIELIKKTSGKYSLLMLGSSIPIIILLVISLVRKKTLHLVFLGSSVAGILLICLSVSTLGLSDLNIVSDSGLLILLPILLSGCFLLFEDAGKKLGYIMALAGLLVVLIMAENTHHTYRIDSAKGFVNSSDMATYEWINTSLPPGSGFVGLSQNDSNRSSIIFPVDGSAWLPVYTDSQIATPFQEVRFNSLESNINYIYFLKFTSGDIAQQKQALKYYRESGFDYLYVDGSNSMKAMRIEQLESSGIIKELHTNGDVKIFKLS